MSFLASIHNLKQINHFTSQESGGIGALVELEDVGDELGFGWDAGPAIGSPAGSTSLKRKVAVPTEVFVPPASPWIPSEAGTDLILSYGQFNNHLYSFFAFKIKT